MQVRRVVTGQRTDGKSVFVDDALVEPKSPALMSRTVFHQVWGSDSAVSLPTNGLEPPWSSFFPPETGFRFLIWTAAPETATLPDDLDLRAAFTELQEMLPGVADFNEPDNPGMHTTDTVDFDLVLSGEIWLELDDGEEVLLGPGDCVIQNGTRHAWHNRTNEPTTMVSVLIGAPRGT
jgi:mannose-6-phosphate isomerase-like protein (cupin superfamily)